MGTRCWTRTPRAGSQAVPQACQSAFSSAQFGSTPPPHFVNLTKCPPRSRYPYSSHSNPVLERITSNIMHTFLSTMQGHHSTSPSCRVNCWPQKNGRFYGPVTSKVHDTTDVISGRRKQPNGRHEGVKITTGSWRFQIVRVVLNGLGRKFFIFTNSVNLV
jgi:hypothetical protein